jgi:hypothetical protein
MSLCPHTRDHLLRVVADLAMDMDGWAVNAQLDDDDVLVITIGRAEPGKRPDYTVTTKLPGARVATHPRGVRGILAYALERLESEWGDFFDVLGNPHPVDLEDS